MGNKYGAEWVFLDILKYNLKQIIQNKKNLNSKKIVFFGITETTNVAIELLKKDGIETYAIIDNNPSRRNMTLEDVNVYSPEELLNPYNKDIIIFIGTPYFNEMSHQVEKMGYYKNEQVFQVFDPIKMMEQYCVKDLKKVELNESKKIQLNILKYVRDLCEKNKLTYYLAYGTLLGAIRHKGFIPWDDDIDIYMPIEDIKKLYSLFKADDRYLMSMPGESNGYFYLYPRVIDTHTILNIVDFPLLIKSGISIDVFPIIGLGDDIQQAKYSIDSSYEQQRLIRNMISKKSDEESIKSQIKFMWDEYEKHNYLEEKYCGGIFGPYGYREIVQSKEFIECIPFTFEHEKFVGPIGYDEYLTQIYGDYMTYPPIEKRTSSHIWEGYYCIEEEE